MIYGSLEIATSARCCPSEGASGSRSHRLQLAKRNSLQKEIDNGNRTSASVNLHDDREPSQSKTS